VFVGDECGAQLEPRGRSRHDVLDFPRRGVGVDPDPHGAKQAAAGMAATRPSGIPSAGTRGLIGAPLGWIR
jgi:hypothetical protein